MLLFRFIFRDIFLNRQVQSVSQTKTDSNRLEASESRKEVGRQKYDSSLLRVNVRVEEGFDSHYIPFLAGFVRKNDLPSRWFLSSSRPLPIIEVPYFTVSWLEKQGKAIGRRVSVPHLVRGRPARVPPLRGALQQPAAPVESFRTERISVVVKP